MALKQNTWKLNQWYDQDVAGNVSYTTSLYGLWGWGKNASGQMAGNSTAAASYSSPVQVPGTTWKQIGMDGNGQYGMIASKTDGTLWVWGHNHNGQLGQNQATAQLAALSSPTQIPGTNWSDAFHSWTSSTLASKTDGTLWTWGNGNNGTLGQNQPDNTDYSSPVQIPGSNWGTTRGKVGRSIAIKTDGTLWSWGAYNANNVADNPGKRSSPIQIPGTNWSTVKSIAYGKCAVKTDGTLWIWGTNGNGKFMQNNQTEYSSPIQIPGTWKTTMSGGSHYTSAFIKQDGTLWMAGDNEKGYLGQNDTVKRSSPVQIPGSWDQVGQAAYATMGIKTDGTAWVWGQTNEYGELGLNAGVNYSSPVQLPGTDWDQPQGGMLQMFALQKV